jgi:hypothetical protein
VGIFGKLHNELVAVEDMSEHEGYLYRVSDTLLLLILGMLCGLQRIDDIHDWAKSKPTGAFLSKRFAIENIPCRAQIYNILKRRISMFATQTPPHGGRPSWRYAMSSSLRSHL